MSVTSHNHDSPAIIEALQESHREALTLEQLKMYTTCKRPQHTPLGYASLNESVNSPLDDLAARINNAKIENAELRKTSGITKVAVKLSKVSDTVVTLNSIVEAISEYVNCTDWLTKDEKSDVLNVCITDLSMRYHAIQKSKILHRFGNAAEQLPASFLYGEIYIRIHRVLEDCHSKHDMGSARFLAYFRVMLLKKINTNELLQRLKQLLEGGQPLADNEVELFKLELSKYQKITDSTAKEQTDHLSWIENTKQSTETTSGYTKLDRHPSGQRYLQSTLNKRIWDDNEYQEAVDEKSDSEVAQDSDEDIDEGQIFQRTRVGESHHVVYPIRAQISNTLAGQTLLTETKHDFKYNLKMPVIDIGAEHKPTLAEKREEFEKYYQEFFADYVDENLKLNELDDENMQPYVPANFNNVLNKMTYISSGVHFTYDPQPVGKNTSEPDLLGYLQFLKNTPTDFIGKYMFEHHPVPDDPIALPKPPQKNEETDKELKNGIWKPLATFKSDDILTTDEHGLVTSAVHHSSQIVLQQSTEEDPAFVQINYFQERLEIVWNKLKMPLQERLEMALKYAANSFTKHLPGAVTALEDLTEKILRREALQQRFVTFQTENSNASRLFLDQAEDLQIQNQAREKLKQPLDELSEETYKLCRRMLTKYDTKVTFNGVSYTEIIKGK